MDEFEKLIQTYPKAFISGLLLVSLVAVVAGYAGASLRQVHIDLEGKPGPISTQENTGYIFSVASSTGEGYFVVANNGNVGVNTDAPEVNLDIAGLLRSRWAFLPPCTKDIEGAMTYDRTTHHFTGCNGHDWRILDN